MMYLNNKCMKKKDNFNYKEEVEAHLCLAKASFQFKRNIETI